MERLVVVVIYSVFHINRPLSYKERRFETYSPSLVGKGLGVRSDGIVVHITENCCKVFHRSRAKKFRYELTCVTTFKLQPTVVT